MKKIVLLVVDVQNLLVWEHPHKEKELIINLQKLIQTAREAKVEVIYVRHDDGPDTDLTAGKEGWEIYKEISPLPNEKIIEKFYNSAFHKTDLNEYLIHKGVEQIMLVGMQTEFCIDATLRSAFDLEYKVLIPWGANTTYDNDYMKAEQLLNYYHNMIWDNRYGEVVSMEQAIVVLGGKTD